MRLPKFGGFLSRLNATRGRDRLAGWMAGLLAASMAALLIIPFAGLLWRAFTLEGGLAAGDPSLGSAIALSLGTTAVSVGLIVLLGTPLAYFLARHRFPLKRLLTLFVEMPIVMPPVVAGLALLSAFGRRGLLGRPLEALDVTIPFTLAAVILAQIFVASPFYIRTAQSRFESLPREYEDAAAVDGAHRWVIFWRIILPQSSRAMLTGVILSWARALGEFGATILFAGNLPGKTQTMPLLVYGALARDLRVTFDTALILLGLAVLAFSVTRWLASAGDDDGDTVAYLK